MTNIVFFFRIFLVALGYFNSFSDIFLGFRRESKGNHVKTLCFIIHSLCNLFREECLEILKIGFSLMSCGKIFVRCLLLILVIKEFTNTCI